ncbi:putative uronyl 2-sulfotransferase [Apostichopus japonicus]|uniref:Putative uronyl 2-sulfotransferase n=1 Tax=Stichopus japonicus TaxID=307972 RepID=A0A2G8JJL5_STIJA|nr:putative uronyl 2-sulfotransferase [Apostichopus japonicus]
MTHVQLILLQIIVVTNVGLVKHVDGLQQPAVVVNSGDSAHILCTTQGDGYAYFWRKGPSFNIYITSIVRGLHDSTSERFSVSSEGILTITNITAEDEGIYYCRLVSDDNDCHGHVDVYVNVKQDKHSVMIQECSPGKSCVLYILPYTKTIITCTAKDVSPTTDLTWFNGTEVISTASTRRNKTGRNILSTITINYEFPVVLTCEASDQMLLNLRTELASVYLESKASVASNTSGKGWIASVILAVLLVILLTISGIFVKKTTRQLKKYEKKEKIKADEHTELMTEEENLQRIKEEVSKNELRLTSIKKSLRNFQKIERAARITTLDAKHPVRLLVVDESNVQEFKPKNNELKTMLYANKSKSEVLYAAVTDLIENAIDGGNSCILSYGLNSDEQRSTLYGSNKDTAEGLLFQSVRLLFLKTADMQSMGFEIKIKGIFVRFVKGGVVNTGPNDAQVVQKEITKVPLKDEVEVAELLEQHKTTTDNSLVRLFVEETHNNLPVTSGKISFVTTKTLDMAKNCLQKTNDDSFFPNHIADIFYEENCKCAIIANLHEQNREDYKKAIKLAKSVRLAKRNVKDRDKHVFVFDSEIKTTFQIKTTVKVVANQQTMPLHIAEEKIALTDAFRREMEWAVKPEYDFIKEANALGKIRHGENYIVIYNNVPKCGSRSLVNAFKGVPSNTSIKRIDVGFNDDILCYHNNRNEFVNRTGPLRGASSTQTAYDRSQSYAIRTTKQCLTRNVKVIMLMIKCDLWSYIRGQQKTDVLYINVVRDPVARYVSAYYFAANGDNGGTMPKGKREMKNITIDEAVKQRTKWKGTTKLSSFFTERTNDTAGDKLHLERAKSTIEKHYTLVGVAEEMDKVTRLLEILIPGMFPGLNKIYTDDYEG